MSPVATLLIAPAAEPNAFDRLTDLVARVLRVPLALVSLLEADRQSFVGLHGTLPSIWANRRETPLSHSFCQHVARSGEVLIITDARQDERVLDSLAVPDLGVIAYLGVPLTNAEGFTMGSLCAIDHQPRSWSEEDIDVLRHLAGFAVAELETSRQERLLTEAKPPFPVSGASPSHRVRLLVHDLRTPLNNLLLGLKTLPLMGELNADQREVLDLATRGGDALVALVDDLLDVDGSAGGGEGVDGGVGSMALRYGPADPASILAQARAQVAALARERSLVFVMVADPALPATIEVDAVRLGRALVNLLANAVKFTPAGGVVSSTAQLGGGGQTMIFTVRDTGTGIAPEDQARIFLPYVRLDDGDGGNCGGGARGHSSGLGLTFVRLVAEAHGGRVQVQSTPGEGSAFLLTVPVRPGSAPARRNESPV